MSLAVAMPRLRHHTDPPAMLGGSVAELGAPGAELAVRDGRVHSSGGGAPCLTSSCFFFFFLTSSSSLFLL